MIKKSAILVIFFSTLSGIIFSQKSDFGIWAGVTGAYKLDKHLEAKMSVAVRTIDNTSKTDQYFAEVGLGYRFNDYATLEGSYRMINKKESDLLFHFRHKLYLSIKGTLPVGRLAFSGRLMYQKTMKSYIEDGNDMIPQHYARLKLKTTYTVPSSPFSPFISVEPFIPIKNGNGFETKKSRYSGGVEIRMSNHSSLEAGYIYEMYNNAPVPGMHIFSVNLDFSF